MVQSRIPSRYRVIEEVGQGGMAVVYRAHDEKLKREVAIKLLHEHLSAEPDSKARLEREAQAVAKLRHENILAIFDYSGSDSPSSYIVTEFIDGRTLRQFLELRPIVFPEVAALIAAEMGGALGHAHAVGIIHRDVKPENVMIRRDGLLKLTDFGIAQVVNLQRMTVTGQLLGSPAYMAPELIEGKALDFRTDVFSVGIMLYQLATGVLPFSGKNPHEVLKRITDGQYADPRSQSKRVSDRLQRIMARALARRPEDRYPDLGPLVDDLHEYLEEAGLGDTRAELRGFFTDPDAYERDLPGRLAAALLATGRRHLEAGRTARALEAWNRVLVHDPTNTEVLAGLRRLEGRRRLRAMLLVAAAVAVVAGGLAGVARLAGPGRGGAPAQQPSTATPAVASLPAPHLAPGPTAAPAPAATPPTGATPTPTPLRPRQPPAQAREPAERLTRAVSPPATTPPSPTPAAAPSALAEQRTFRLGLSQRADVYLDGKRLFEYGLNNTTVTVPWDRTHTIEIRSPTECCEPALVKVGPSEPLPPGGAIVRRLAWRPARVTATLTPPEEGALVLVKAGQKSRRVAPGQEIRVDVGEDGKAQVELNAVMADEELGPTKKLQVTAGQTYSVDLEPKR